jgi:hypothetical protein
MQKVSIVIFDTAKNKKLARFALSQASKLDNIGDIHIFSDEAFFPGAIFHPISIIRSSNDYSHHVLSLSPDNFIEDRFLIIQWDGFPVDLNYWTNEFLQYDYIGAPMHGPEGWWVGNGGFSLRSKNLLRSIKDLNIRVDESSKEDQPEDQLICLRNGGQLKKHGIKFAPLNIAKKFSFQHGLIDKKSLGFHSYHLLPVFIAEDILCELTPEIIERQSSVELTMSYLENCLVFGKLDLFRLSLESLRRKERLFNEIEAEMYRNPNCGLVQALKRFE